MKLFTEKIEKIALYVVILDIILIPLMMFWSYMDWARKTPYDKEVMERLERIEETLSDPSGSLIGFMVLEANRVGVNPSLANRIIWCESRWNPNAKNPTTSAHGLFQITDGTWEYAVKKMGERVELMYSNNDAYNQLEVGIWLLANEGTHHWKSSKSCWSK